jgi:hypothetical protein
VSQIAMANAFFRARESARPPGEQILVDPLAERLVRTIWSLQLLWWGRGLVPGMSLLLEPLQTVHCVRHAAVDALVSRALDAGCTQVVTLGAGLDARPARLPGAGRARQRTRQCAAVAESADAAGRCSGGRSDTGPGRARSAARGGRGPRPPVRRSVDTESMS